VKIVKLTLLSSVVAFNLAAMDLGTYMSGVANSDPSIIQKKKQFNSVYETLKISEGDWFLPSVDLEAGISRSRTNYKKPTSSTSTYTNRYLNISATENLFNGYGTVNDIAAKKAALASMAYSYAQTLDEELLNSSKAYIDVARNKELLDIEVDNYQKHKKIMEAVSIRNGSGVGVIGDLQEITSKTNLAYVNYVTQSKNLKASQISARKFYGNPLDINSVQTPSVGYELNYTPSSAISFAFSHNPALYVQKYNVIAARYNKKRDEKEFMPKVDLSIAHNYSGGENADTHSGSEYKQLSGGISLKWNLFRGFKDVHTRHKNISIMHQEYQKYEAIKRSLAEEIELSLSNYNSQKREYEYLTKYVSSASQKLNTITTLFRNGKKSLFEFLASQTDYNSAKEKLINTKYDLIYTKLKVLKALGVLSDMVNPSLKSEVGISTNGIYDYRALNHNPDRLPLPVDSGVPAAVIPSAVAVDNFMSSYAISNTSSNCDAVVQTTVAPAVAQDARFENDEQFKKVYDEEFIAPKK